MGIALVQAQRTGRHPPEMLERMGTGQHGGTGKASQKGPLGRGSERRGCHTAAPSRRGGTGQCGIWWQVRVGLRHQKDSRALTGTWSEAFSRPRTGRQICTLASASAACGLRAKWSMRMP